MAGRKRKYGFTEIEKEILALLAEGFDNFEISNKLFFSLETIKRHKVSIFSKMGVKNSIQAAVKAIRETSV